jgi:hypothetical protein
MPSGCGRPVDSVFMRCSSQVDFSPSPSVRISASRTRPSGPPGRPRASAMTSSSRHFSSSYRPSSQIVTLPPPYSPRGMLPSNVRVVHRWSSVMIARLLRL